MEVLFNHIKRKETDKEELPFPKKAGLISTFTMSNMLLKCIALIVRRIHSSDLLDFPLFAIKPPFHPKSSRCSFSECLYTKHFHKSALLDLPRSLMPRGKVHQNRGNPRHFPGGKRRQVPREMAVEPMPQQATGKSAPKSRKFATLSPGGWRRQVPREMAVEPVPQQATGRVHQNRGSGVHSRQETQKMRTGHSATRKDLPPSAQEGGARREAVGGPGLFDC